MEQLHNGFTLELAPGTLPLSTDSIALADFTKLPKNAQVLDLGSGCGTLGLLLCAGANAARVHLSEHAKTGPMEPPMFCMLLRKHLSGGRLRTIEQPPMERCAVFTFDTIDEMGDSVQKKLVAELMGRTCNLYLLSPEGRIIDCLRRIGLDESAKRAALPGLNYQKPDPITKQNPKDLACHPEGAKRFEGSSGFGNCEDSSTSLRSAQNDILF